MMDFDLKRDVGLRWRVNRDVQSPSAQGGVLPLQTELCQGQAGTLRRRAPVGDLGKATNFLKQR